MSCDWDILPVLILLLKGKARSFINHKIPRGVYTLRWPSITSAFDIIMDLGRTVGSKNRLKQCGGDIPAAAITYCLDNLSSSVGKGKVLRLLLLSYKLATFC